MKSGLLLLALAWAMVEHPIASWGAPCSLRPHARAQVAFAQDGGGANPDHREPARDFFCSHNSKKPAEQCACHRHCVKDAEGKVTGSDRDPSCKSDCYERHCHCGVECDVT